MQTLTLHSHESTTAESENAENISEDHFTNQNKNEDTKPDKNLPEYDKHEFYKSETTSTMKLHYIDEDQANSSEAYYNYETGDYAVFNPKTNQTEFGKYKSGTEERWQGYREIPKGDYAVLEMQGEGYFRLEAFDQRFGDDKVHKTGQTLLRQHPGNTSHGCVTARDLATWNRTEPVIRSSRAGEVSVESKSRRGRILGLRESESVGYFGTLKVF